MGCTGHHGAEKEIHTAVGAVRERREEKSIFVYC